MHVIDQDILEVFFSFFVIVLRGASSLSFLLPLLFLFFIFTVHDNDLDNDLLSLYVFHFDPRTFLYVLSSLYSICK